MDENNATAVVETLGDIHRVLCDLYKKLELMHRTQLEMLELQERQFQEMKH